MMPNRTVLLPWLLGWLVVLLVLARGCREAPVTPEPPVRTAQMTITVSVDARGTAMFALCDSERSYTGEDEPFMTATAPVKDGRARTVFRDVPFGLYALKAYCDENRNQKLDTGLFGRPTEPYGYSNNARVKFGQPDWDAVAFRVEQPEVRLRIDLK